MKNAGISSLLVVSMWAVVPVMAFGQNIRVPTELSADQLPGSSAAVPAPAATLDGTIRPVPLDCQPPPPYWDPYGTPGANSAPLYPSDPSFQFGAPGPSGGPPITFATATKFLQEVRLDYVWMPGTAAREFGINDIELSSTFAFPAFYNPDTPLLITPGFAVHLWNGPSGAVLGADLPPRVYDAYLDAAWNPQITTWLGGELSFRIGVYSDFRKADFDSLRYTGKGLLRLAGTPSFTVKAGVWYLHRVRIKMLPAGGIVWTPNPNVRFDILFPDPKLAWLMTTYGSVEWWGYLRGEYGGGSWSIEGPPGVVEKIDYNDIRVAVGVDFNAQNVCNGLFEVGVAFQRELFHAIGGAFDLNTTVFVRGGFAF